MTDIWLAGAENPAHHELFSLCETEYVALNVGSWKRNYSKDWELKHGFKPKNWVAWTDSPASIEDLDEVIQLVGSSPEACIGSDEWSDHPHYMEVWNGDSKFPITSIGSGLVVTDAVFTDSAMNKRVLSSKKRDMKLGVITGKSKGDIEKYDFVISSAWWSAQKHGETQLWDGSHFHRVNASKKMEFRSLHQEAISDLGVNVWDVMDDDSTAVASLAIRSWMAYGDHLGATGSIDIVKSEAANLPISESEESGSSSHALDMPPRRGRHVLPSMTVLEQHDPETDTTVQHVRSTGQSLRQCDNCHLAQACPAFSPGESCAYSIPVVIRTKSHIDNVLQAMLEIQSQRVFQGRHGEEITGQELDPTVGKEMERLFSMMETYRDIMDNRESVSIAIDAKGGESGGILSKLFGSDVGNNAQELDSPIESEALEESIADADVR